MQKRWQFVSRLKRASERALFQGNKEQSVDMRTEWNGHTHTHAHSHTKGEASECVWLLWRASSSRRMGQKGRVTGDKLRVLTVEALKAYETNNLIRY